MIVWPKKRSFSRWRKLASAPYSLLRALEYEAIEGLELVGRVLDIGGGDGRDYHHLLRLHGTLETVNIDQAMRPTYLLDLENPLPFENECFDHVISLNTFEHICNDDLAISEALRVLKSGGTFHIVVPFCYRVHGSPSDYHRHTAYWWEQRIAAAGMSHCTIEPLTWDPGSSAYALLGKSRNLARGLLMLIALADTGYWLRRLNALIPILRDLPWWPGGRVTLNERQMIVNNWAASLALGYYISGQK